MPFSLRLTVAAVGLCVVAGSALAQFPPVTDPNNSEAKCQANASKALGKFVGAKTKCVSNCIKTARKTMGPYDGCFGPSFTDPATQTCMFAPLKGAEAKAEVAISRGCLVDCPECYDSMDPTICPSGGAGSFIPDTESQVDPLPSLFYCVEVGGSTPTPAEAKCEDTVAKVIAKFWSAHSKCYEKCRANVQTGTIAPGSCAPPAPTDPVTSACIADPIKGAWAKALLAINKACETTSGQKPSCFPPTNVVFVGAVESIVDSRVPTVLCDEPKTVFATSTQSSGAMGNLGGADVICRNRASAAGLSGTFKAWLSDASTSAASRLNHASADYVLVDGTLIAHGWTDLTDGTLDAPIDMDELGNTVSGGVWTNSTVDGNIDAAECAGWSTTVPGTKGQTGSTSATNAAWTDDIALEDCSQMRRLYCFQQ